MKIICCYAKLHPATEWSVRKFAPEAEFVDTSADDFAYWRALRSFWTGKEDLVVIEQDIEINADVIPSFIKCYEQWCVYEYEMSVPGGWLRESLGCTKFSAAMQRACPADLICAGDHKWDGLDITMGVAFARHAADVISPYARKQGGRPGSHIHGALRHHHAYKRNPIVERNGVIPGGTLHSRAFCEFCD